ncbi:hypothetical protein HaLaN_08536, partial [Haematococcus lacustris]
MRLYGAQQKVLERYFKKLEEEAAIESQKGLGTHKQLVVYFGRHWHPGVVVVAARNWEVGG